MMACATALAGCGDDEGTLSDAGSDAGQVTPGDAGRDAGGDAGRTPTDAGDESDAGSTDDDGGVVEPAPEVDDPLPGSDEPGEYGCTGCPSSSDFSDFSPDFGAVTTNAFGGTISDVVGDGVFYVANDSGATFSGTIPTDPVTGVYNVTVPLLCGQQTIKLVWSNPVGNYGVVLDANTTDCIDADIRATLTWDELGADFELHLVREGGTINDRTGDRYYSNDCTWNTCIGGAADWGVEGETADNPKKDVDNTGNYGPENIFYAMPEPGIYTVMVEHWGGGDPNANGNVIINVTGQRTVAIPIRALASHWVFTAATIEWPSGKITRVAEQYDCNATWSGGCTAAIP